MNINITPKTKKISIITMVVLVILFLGSCVFGGNKSIAEPTNPKKGSYKIVTTTGVPKSSGIPGVFVTQTTRPGSVVEEGPSTEYIDELWRIDIKVLDFVMANERFTPNKKDGKIGWNTDIKVAKQKGWDGKQPINSDVAMEILASELIDSYNSIAPQYTNPNIHNINSRVVSVLIAWNRFDDTVLTPELKDMSYVNERKFTYMFVDYENSDSELVSYRYACANLIRADLYETLFEVP